MKLLELFDNPVQPTSHESGSYGDTYVFKVGDITYEILISTFGHAVWDVSFDAQIVPGERVDHATGTGNEVAVFSTVNAVVVKFLQRELHRVRTLSFTADIDSRAKLYKRLATRWANQFKMDIAVGKDIIDQHEFVLTNPNYRA